MTTEEVRSLLSVLGPLGETCDRPHPYMRGGLGTDRKTPHALPWRCSLAKGHDGRCQMGAVLWPEDRPILGQWEKS